MIILKKLLVLVFFYSTVTFADKGLAKKKHPLLLLSIDGYRYDYTKLYKPKNLMRFANDGVQAHKLVPVYPSLTFPNHLSLITGVVPSEHGIVANNFFDPMTKQTFTMSRKESFWFQANPLWNEIRQFGLRSATMFWPGSESNINGLKPHYSIKYDPNVSNDERVRQIINWLELPENLKPNFITSYFSSVDKMGHKFGPNSPETQIAIAELDESLGRLFKYIEHNKIKINIVIVSDHGMKDLSRIKHVYLTDLIPGEISKIKIINFGSFAMIYLKDSEDGAFIVKQLNISKHLKAYLRNETPSVFNMTNNERFGDIIIEVDPNYYLFTAKEKLNLTIKGGHGYNPRNSPDMSGIFYARGPDVLNNQHISSIAITQVYVILKKLLGIDVRETLSFSKRIFVP